MRHATILGLVILGSLAHSASEKEPKFTPDQVGFFEKEVQPILKEHCFKCHSGKKMRGGLRLDGRASILKGGDLGPAVKLDEVDASPLLKAVHFKDGLEMPPSGKLPPASIETLTKWVRMGLPYSPGKEEIAKAPEHGKMEITAADREWWAYRPLKQPPVPQVKATSWLRNGIDAFIAAKLEAKGLSPNGEADRVALARRLYYDLTGLPPTPAQVDEFVHDRRPDAYERLVDALLASPGYGEKWGRHWLDLVRFAETNGYERDGPKPFAWRFRDYVVRSFNADKGYDTFIREQLAGDEMPGDDADRIIATGYYRLGLWDDEPVDMKQARADEIDDWVSTTGQVFLAMTLNCARCHDHKKDPIPQADYYKMVAFFQDVKHFSNTRDPRSMSNLTDITPRELRKTYEGELNRREVRKAELAEAMRKLEDEVIKRMPAEDQRASEGLDRPQVLQKMSKHFKGEEKASYAKLRGERARLDRKTIPNQEMALSVNNCLARPPVTNVMVRGSPHALGAKVEPGFPVVLSPEAPAIPEAPKGARSSGRRSVLAAWIVGKGNQVTPRVMANRLWQFHFGRGIVGSSNDFGKLGELPTHPELLDWLAVELARDWSLKRMHRMILTSATYRQSSTARPDELAKDPGNSLWWRFPMRRLTAEEVRDSMLTVSGELNRRMAGPGVYPTIPPAVLAGQSQPGSGWGKSPPAEQARRSVYVHIKRSLIVPILQTHDLADTDSSCAVRYTTTVPTQALGLLNGEFSHEQAAAFADRLGSEGGDLTAQVQRAIRLTTGRAPSPDEVAKDVAFVRELERESKLDAKAALKLYCLMALNSNEFMYLD
jgi:hypothetical protein